MHRWLSLLLIPVFVLGHALPHSHAGSGVVEPDGHALRPHIHVHGHHHHHHGDAEAHHHHQHQPEASEANADSQVLPLVDHDSDAIYLAASSCSLLRASRLPTGDVVAVIPSQIEMGIAIDRPSEARTTDPPRRCAPLPLYLLTASLRL